MCGIAGALVAGSNENASSLQQIITQMTQTLVHRGPDDCGTWVDEYAGISLGHRRLSILDLSPAGHQPMVSANGRYVLVFNGEIYNFQQLRQQLEKSDIRFRGHSDTEVLLEGVAHWGLEKTLRSCNGMFAFALWDRERRELTLVRDRIGKKPLYYGWCGKTFLFGSELKALKAHPHFNADINRQALGQFIQYGWINGPASIYQNVCKLMPGSYIKISSVSAGEIASSDRYWLLEDEVEKAQAELFTGTYEQAVDELEVRLSKSVKQRMIADVELGSLLSGGIDSSLVTSLMQSQSSRQMKTFSIGFYEESHNEAVHAKKVADHIGTDHTELYVTPQECLNVIPELPTIYDEPFADASQIPTYLVSKLARNDVKVVLSGDGGDELFVGYTRYFRCMQHWKKQRKIPHLLKPIFTEVLRELSDSFWQISRLSAKAGGLSAIKNMGEKLGKRANRLDAKSAEELFVLMMRQYGPIDRLVINGEHRHTIQTQPQAWPKMLNPMLTMTYIDLVNYLVDDILVKVDRASMAASLEARCPLLDIDIIRFAWSLPFEMKVNDNGGKRILKDLLSRYVPNELTERKKMGFGVPVGEWLRGPLKDWAEDLLDEKKLKEQSFFTPALVRKLWKQHQSGWGGNKEILWSILMFQAWLTTK